LNLNSIAATAGFLLLFTLSSSYPALSELSQLPSANKHHIPVTICHKKHHFSQTLHPESWHHAGDEFLFGFISTHNNSNMSLYKEIPC
ncbi:MAG: hypothetical protein ACRAUW_12645, partial [Aeromonas sp.]|uniref:hypothetical protein n=1 Tax=Aeromonas sp. TaxID=647 RepID=UPI003D6B72CD